VPELTRFCSELCFIWSSELSLNTYHSPCFAGSDKW
jgi:hypothetical protein